MHLIEHNESGWHALPGNRIELAATGFAIEFTPGRDVPWFTAYCPDGSKLAVGMQLQVMKQWLEQLHRDRCEFVFTGEPWPVPKKGSTS